MQSLNRLKSERPRRAYDFYETPIGLVKASLNRFCSDENDPRLFTSLDAGAGNGVWGLGYRQTIPYDDCLFGIEMQDIRKPFPLSNVYDVWADNQDYLDYTSDNDLFGLIFGNPPYSLAEEFVRHSMKLVSDNGYVYFLFRLAFLESKKRIPLYKDYPPKRVYVLQRRPSFFSANGKTRTTDATSYAMFLWQKGWKGQTELDWLYWEYDK